MASQTTSTFFFVLIAKISSISNRWLDEKSIFLFFFKFLLINSKFTIVGEVNVKPKGL